ncbi:MAG TPA: RNA-protein complex protein Nop10 [Euryarchaeota archaeon]|nr:RNA-protein complex protein Nop10 [Euryarchaeota archaeon]
MKTSLRRCGACGAYTLSERCPKCDLPTVMPMPARYSPEDRLGKYRRAMRPDRV